MSDAKYLIQDPFILQYEDPPFHAYYTCFQLSFPKKAYECLKGRFDISWSNKQLLYSRESWKEYKVPKGLSSPFIAEYIQKQISPTIHQEVRIIRFPYIETVAAASTLGR